MAEAFPKDVLLRVGGAVLARHGIAAVAGARRGSVEVPITMARADASTCATTIDRDGIVRLAAANVLRVQWEDLDGDGIRETPGLLLEGSRIQGFQFTEDLTNAVWFKNNCTISANADGAADGVVGTVGTSQINIGQNTGALTASTQQSTFFEVKAGNKTWAYVLTVDKSNTTRVSWVNLSTGAVGTKDASHTIVVLKVGTYYRIQVMWPSATGATGPQAYCGPANADASTAGTGDGATINIYVRNSQMEVDQAFPSSYIPRLGAGAVTRAADAFTLPFNFGPMDLTVLARVARPVWADASGTIGLFPAIFGLSTTAAIIEMVAENTSRQMYSSIDTPTTDATATLTPLPAGTPWTIAAQYRLLTTGGKTKLDGGSGFTSESPAATAFAAFGNQTLRVGDISGSGPLYGVLLDLKVCRGLFSLNEMLAIP